MPAPRRDDYIRTPPHVQRIIDQLRDPRFSFVVAERADGKTSALIDYVAERTLVLRPKNKVAVIVPNDQMAGHFRELFCGSYPRLGMPIVFTIHEIPDRVRGYADSPIEFYLEEWLSFPLPDFAEALKALGSKIKGGVASISGPTGFSLNHLLVRG